MEKNNFKYITYVLMILIVSFVFTKTINAQNIDKIFNFADSTSFKIIGHEVSCTSYPKTMEILTDVFKYVRIATVLLFLVLTSFDYVNAILSEQKDGFKKSNNHLVTRLIVLITILILPSIINLLLTIIQLNNGNCMIK